MAGTARIRHSFLVLSLVLVASAAGAFSTSGAVSADERGGSYSVTDVSLVYLGNPRLFRRPCVLSADRVYRAIPEYREILEKNLTDRDVRYHFLMKKASDKFAAAIREVSQSGGFDLVAGIGSVIASTTDTPVPPDVTAAAISKLPS